MAEYLPPIEGSIRTRIVNEIRFKFVASGSAVPFVVLTNHDAGESGRLEFQGRPVRFRFLIAPTGPNGHWQRTDAAEPSVDFADGPDKVPDFLRQSIHDSCLDAWEAYSSARPDLAGYARLTEANNNIVQCDDKIAKLEQQIARLQEDVRKEKGRRANLVAMSQRIKDTLPKPLAPLTTDERSILLAMTDDNCWLSLKADAKVAELHPYNSPSVLRDVPFESAQRLVLEGYLRLHRHLADQRATFIVSERGRETMKGPQ